MFEKVKEVILSTLSCEEDDVTLDARLSEDLDADSLDAVELSTALEDEFDIKIPDEALSSFITVGDVVSYIENNQ